MLDAVMLLRPYLWWRPLRPCDLDGAQLPIIASLDAEFDWLAWS